MDTLSYGFDLQSLFGAAQAANSDPEFAQPRTSQTVTSNAIDSMQPIKPNGGAWGDFWQGATATVLNYALLKDATKSGVTVQGTAAQQTETQAAVQQASASSAQSSKLLLVGGLAVVGLLAFVALRR